MLFLPSWGKNQLLLVTTISCSLGVSLDQPVPTSNKKWTNFSYNLISKSFMQTR